MIVSHSNFTEMHADEYGEFKLGRKMDRKSLTVPNQTLDLKTLIERYVRGQNVEVFNGATAPDWVPDDLERMNEMDKIDLARELSVAKRSYFRQKQTEFTQLPEDQSDTQPHPDPSM